jgi:hypothetical protein
MIAYYSTVEVAQHVLAVVGVGFTCRQANTDIIAASLSLYQVENSPQLASRGLGMAEEKCTLFMSG